MDAGYDEVLHKLKEKFFPHGRNEKGRLEQFEAELGTAKQNIINRDNFTAGEYSSKTSGTGRTRIYLLTKRKFTDFASLSTSEDSDLEVPPPWKRTRTIEGDTVLMSGDTMSGSTMPVTHSFPMPMTQSTQTMSMTQPSQTIPVSFGMQVQVSQPQQLQVMSSPMATHSSNLHSSAQHVDAGTPTEKTDFAM